MQNGMPFSLLVALTLVSTLASAADQLSELTELYATEEIPGYDAETPGLRGLVGGALLGFDRAVGDSRAGAPLPILLMSYGDRVYWTVASGGFWLLNGESPVRIGAGVQLRPGWEPRDDPLLEGMDERKGTIDGTIHMRWKTPLFNMRLGYFHDLAHVSEGASTVLRLSRNIHLQRHWLLTPSLGLEWQSAALVNHYYGVKPQEALPTRPAYEGRSVTNFTTGLAASYFVGEWCLLGGIHSTYRGDAITESPIVTDRRVNLIFVGAALRF